MNRAFWQWCRRAVRLLPFRTQRENAARELYWHLEDAYEALREKGFGESEAQAQAIAAMGDVRLVRRQLLAAHLSVREGSNMLMELIAQSKWTNYYRGRDRERYARLCWAFDRAGVPYDAQEFDMTSRFSSQVLSNSQQRVKGMYMTANPEPVQLKQLGGEELNLYTLRVRGRDVAAARRAEYALSQEPEA